MSVAPASTSSLPRRSQRQTPSVRPVPKPQPRKPLVMGRARVGVEEVEGEICAASVELVCQRSDLAEAASPEDNRLLRQAIRALDNGDKTLARELMVAALFIADRQDTAAIRAEGRRERAHGRQKNAVARAESLITGRELELPYSLDGVMATGVCGAEREPMGAISFERCGQPAGHEQDDGVHVFLAQGPEGQGAT